MNPHPSPTDLSRAAHLGFADGRNAVNRPLEPLDLSPREINEYQRGYLKGQAQPDTLMLPIDPSTPPRPPMDPPTATKGKTRKWKRPTQTNTPCASAPASPTPSPTSTAPAPSNTPPEPTSAATSPAGTPAPNNAGTNS